MNRIIVLHALPQNQPMAYNQATVVSYDEITMGEVNLVVELVDADTRVPNDCAVFGFTNELGVITQIASIDDVTGVFGPPTDIAVELREATRGLVEALS